MGRKVESRGWRVKSEDKNDELRNQNEESIKNNEIPMTKNRKPPFLRTVTKKWCDTSHPTELNRKERT